MDVHTLIEKAGGAEKLAAIAGVSRQRVQDWKRDNTIPGNRVPAICDGLNIDANGLVHLIPKRKRRTTGRPSAEARA